MGVEIIEDRPGGKYLGTRATGTGYAIELLPDQPPKITLDHSKARLNRLPSSGEVETFEIVEK